MNQRELALNILLQTIKDESYSNLLMRKELEKLPVIQRSFVTNLINGVLRKYEILNFQFQNEIKNNTSLKTKLILCMALYERFYLKEKDYVVNNEYVELGDTKFEKSFINAILHKLNVFKISENESINRNLPEWIYRLLSSQYEQEEFEKICEVYQSIPKVYYRLNKNKGSFEDLRQYNIKTIDDTSFVCDKNLLLTNEYKNGLFYVQDYNSSSLYRHLDLDEKDVLLDVCSAPGSKLFNCLDVVKPQNAYSNDYHLKRVELIKKMALKLGFDGIHYLNEDGRNLSSVLNIKFDKILMDVPCSGLGVIGRKPDLKFHIKPESLDELQILQKELLLNCSELLKKNGILVYSTCTLNKKENSKQIHSFLKTNPDFELLQEETIINNMGDCFYYAKLRKKV